jgi:hypothetical protein
MRQAFWKSFAVLSFCVALSVNCSAASPGKADMENIQQHLELTHTLAEGSWADYQPEQKGNSLTWTFGHYEGINLSGAGYLDIAPSVDGETRLVVEGDANLALKGTVSSQALALNLTPSTNGKMTLYLPSQTRYLMAEGFKRLSLHNQNQLTYLSVDHVAQVNADASKWMLEYLLMNHATSANLQGIATPYLLAHITDSGSVNFQGSMGLRELDVTDSGPVVFGWLSSPLLTLNTAGKSQVTLAGDATVVNAKVNNNASIDLKYLDTHKLFVQTNDQAKAEVASTQTLNALAAGESKINYYHQPKVLSRFFREKGTILYMGDVVPPCQLSACLKTPVLPG